MTPPTDHPCGICGTLPAPYGFRLPGLLSDLPEKRRGTLWACVACRDQAEARQAQAMVNTHRGG